MQFLRLQRAFTPWLYRARFMDTDGLSVSDPRVQVRRFELPEQVGQGSLLTIVNRQHLSDVSISADDRVLGGIARAFCVTIDGEAGALDLVTLRGRFDRLVRFRVPAAMAAQVLLVGEAAGASALWPILRVVRDGEPHVAVTLLNLSGDAQAGTCRLENLGFPEPREAETEAAREALPLAATALAFDLQPGEAATLRFPVESLRGHSYTVRLQASIEREGRPEIAREFLALPVAHDASFEGQGTPSEFAAEGARVLELGPSEQYQYGAKRLWLEPGHRYRLQAQARRSGFNARVHSTAITMAGESGDLPIMRANMDTARPNEWQTLEYSFETPPDLTRAQLYLYNVESPDTAWFDDVYVEDLGAVEAEG